MRLAYHLSDLSMGRNTRETVPRPKVASGCNSFGSGVLGLHSY